MKRTQLFSKKPKQEPSKARIQEHTNSRFSPMSRSVRRYINGVRVNGAKKRIIGGEPVGSVASFCGFSDPSYFSMVFKKIIGISPREYKKAGMNG